MRYRLQPLKFRLGLLWLKIHFDFNFWLLLDYVCKVEESEMQIAMQTVLLSDDSQMRRSIVEERIKYTEGKRQDESSIRSIALWETFFILFSLQSKWFWQQNLFYLAHSSTNWSPNYTFWPYFDRHCLFSEMKVESKTEANDEDNIPVIICGVSFQDWFPTLF